MSLNKILTILQPLGLELVGSLRRNPNKVHFHDVDFITTRPFNELEAELAQMGVSPVIEGSVYMSFVLPVGSKSFKIDVWKTTEENLPFARFSRIGSRKFNVVSRAVAKMRGYKLTSEGLFDRAGRRISGIHSEQDIFRRIGMTYRKPEEREL